jgi:hypothetical protein
MNDDDRGFSISYDIKDLLVELKADLRQIDGKLDMKADRERVHDLQNDVSSLKLTQAAREEVFRRSQVALEEHDRRLDDVERWRSLLVGGFAAASLFFGVAGALFVYVLTAA